MGPIYRSYVDKAELSEAYAILGTCLSAQKAYYSEYGNFLRFDESTGKTNNEPILGIDIRGNKYFTWFHAGSGKQNHDPKRYFDACVFLPEKFYDGYKSKLRIYYYIDGNGAVFDKVS